MERTVVVQADLFPMSERPSARQSMSHIQGGHPE